MFSRCTKFLLVGTSETLALVGAYNNWVRKYGKLGAEYAFARSKYIAQRWEVRNGGLPSLGIMNDNYNLMISIENPVRIKR